MVGPFVRARRQRSMSRVPFLAGGLALLQAPCGLGAQDAAPVEPDSTLRALAFLAGSWRVPPGHPVLAQRPDLADVVILDVRWVVGGKALRWREQVPADASGAELEGMIYWDPAVEKIRFVGVGGPGEGQGRLLVGTWTPLADGRVERLYDVYYRTLADMPGEELGGSRRRYRDVWAADGPDAITHTLEWWHEGRWQRYGRGDYRLVRAGSGG